MPLKDIIRTRLNHHRVALIPVSSSVLNVVPIPTITYTFDAEGSTWAICETVH
jgi:hypothetical protein